MIVVVGLLLASFCWLTGVNCDSHGGGSHVCDRPCIAGQKITCHFDFTLEWRRTLSRACYNCPFNVTDCAREQCIAADGKIRPAISVNRQIPGPAIRVCEGDSVEVAVSNHLEDGLATSIHWHGMHQLGTPYYDGVGQVTQCNIGHLETFKYRFNAYPHGTHWYHAHTGLQLMDGAFGPLIVKQPQGQDPNDKLYDLDLPEHVLIVYDWAPVPAIERYLNRMHVFDTSRPVSVLVNGKGRKYNVTDSYGLLDTNLTSAMTPLEVLHVQKGKSYRLRFISAAPTCHFQISVDSHELQVISLDGQHLKPRKLDAFIIQPGNRYDFVLRADQEVGNYWVKVIGLVICERAQADGMAILRYQGAPEVEPDSDPAEEREGILLNPILFDGNNPKYGFDNTVIGNAEIRNFQKTNYTEEKVDFKYIIGMDYNNNDNTRYNDKRLYPVVRKFGWQYHVTPVINNISFQLPPVPVLSQQQDVKEAWFCNRSSLRDPDYCLTEDLCLCTHLVRLPLNKVIELIVYHDGRIMKEKGHPMHLHGHSFRLLGLEKIAPHLPRAQLEDLEAGGKLKRNYISPPLMDTVNVPDGGYVILRFKTNNPGFWFFHCHFDTHLEQGMALLIKSGEYSDFPPVPDDFPRCGGMGFSNADRRKQPSCPTSSHGSQIHTDLAVFLVLFCHLL